MTVFVQLTGYKNLAAPTPLIAGQMCDPSRDDFHGDEVVVVHVVQGVEVHVEMSLVLSISAGG